MIQYPLLAFVRTRHTYSVQTHLGKTPTYIKFFLKSKQMIQSVVSVVTEAEQDTIHTL